MVPELLLQPPPEGDRGVQGEQYYLPAQIARVCACADPTGGAERHCAAVRAVRRDVSTHRDQAGPRQGEAGR